MTLADDLAKIKKRLERSSEILTEEATKTAIVMPMIKALGYDVFDPDIVIPEFIADVGVKKGEKVDYAIKVGEKIAILIEAKPVSTDLSKEHASQLYRYFSVTSARFGCLTNGAEWWFYTDLDAANKMDAKPFFRFSLSEFGDIELSELEKFSSEKFSVDGILSAASDLKYKSLITEQVRAEISSPSDDLTRMIGRRVYDGNLTTEVRARFSLLLQASFRDVIRDQVNQRLKDALGRSAQTEPPASLGAANPSEGAPTGGQVQTTDEEAEAFRIIRAIAAKHVQPKRIVMRDAASYCAILLDDNNRKPIARLYLEGKRKRIGLFREKSEEKFEISSLEDIYTFADRMGSCIQEYTGSSGGA